MRIDGNEMVEYRIAPSRHAPAEARRRLQQYLPTTLPSGRLQDAALAVSELVTFGLREHLFPSDPDAGIVLRLDGRGGRVKVEIHGRPPAERGWDSLEESLFEIVVLNAVTSGWGITADGMNVWFTIDRSSVAGRIEGAS